jgi:hypothetical protein
LIQDELKKIARSLRDNTNQCTIGGKFSAAHGCAIPLPALGKDTALFGPRLNIEYPSGFSPALIGTCLLSGEDFSKIPNPPQVSFRAAAVANMYFRPLSIENGTGYEWKIGKLAWLPKTNPRGKD